MKGGHTRLPRYIYAIFPFDSCGKIAGVYIGSSHDLKARLTCHKGSYGEVQTELHQLMRENGYEWKILGSFSEFQDRWHEYLWIDIFEKYTRLKIFNVNKGCYPKERTAQIAKQLFHTERRSE